MLTRIEIEAQREAGKILAEVMIVLAQAVDEGVSPKDIDALAAAECEKRGVLAACLGYHGFPGNLCVSVNHQVVHGVPTSGKAFRGGDLVKLDMAIRHRGVVVDSAVTVPVGAISDEDRELVQATYDALYDGISAARPGSTTEDVAEAVWSIAKNCGFQVNPSFGGHGVGRELHEEPFVPNKPDLYAPHMLHPGTSIAIEPILMAGSEKVRKLGDGWTHVTADKKRSAHFEHTVLITEDGPEILTEWPAGVANTLLGVREQR